MKENDTTEKVLAFIVDFRRRYSVSPTVREIQTGMGFSTTSVVQYHLENLLSAGSLRYGVPNASRSPRNLIPTSGGWETR